LFWTKIPLGLGRTEESVPGDPHPGAPGRPGALGPPRGGAGDDAARGTCCCLLRVRLCVGGCAGGGGGGASPAADSHPRKIEPNPREWSLCPHRCFISACPSHLLPHDGGFQPPTPPLPKPPTTPLAIPTMNPSPARVGSSTTPHLPSGSPPILRPIQHPLPSNPLRQRGGAPGGVASPRLRLPPPPEAPDVPGTRTRPWPTVHLFQGPRGGG